MSLCLAGRFSAIAWFVIGIAVLPLVAGAPQGSLTTINGAKLYVTVEGAGKPVILLHGGFMDSTMWDAQAAALSREFRVIRFDFRGFGRSPKPSGPYLPGNDIAGVLDH